MSTAQITVRIPTELVDFLDGEVTADHARSRADLISRALRRERRRIAAQRDAAIYAARAERADADSLDDLAAAASRTALDID